MKQYNDSNWQNSMKIKLDYNNAMFNTIGYSDGLSLDLINTVSENINKIAKNIEKKECKGNDFLGFLDLPNQDEATLDKIIEEANRVANLSDIFVVLGIGGSYLGARALTEALHSPYYNELSREKRNNKPRIYFEGNNIDTDSISHLFDLLPNKKPESLGESFSINVISKSGATLETAVAFRLFQAKAKSLYGNEHNKYIVAITDEKKGLLKTIADKEGYPTFVIPDNVGGRYSVLTTVGLFPSAVVGIDIKELIAGAKYMKELCSNENIFENPAFMYSAIQYLFYNNKGRDVSVMACWSKALEFFGYWYDQLCAESLGKEGKGRVPITTVNTRDLHSRGQQLQEGQKDTVVTNIFVEKTHRNIIVEKDEENLDKLNYLEGKTLNSMLFGAMEGTNYAYSKDKRPTMNIMIPEINAFTMGQLFYLFEYATLIEGYLMDINPLDQPGVESYKKFMFANLGREDMKAYKEEFDKREKPQDKYIL